MQGSYLHFGLFIGGTLTADVVREFKAPFDLQLVAGSFQAGNTTSVIIDIGTAADPDAYLDAKELTGATAVPTSLGQADWVNAQYPLIPQDTVVQITVDYDGGGGGDGANVNLDLWFTY